MKQTHLTHRFVEFIPEQLDTGVIYISRRYGIAAHRCCCGCGKEVITPLTPTDWSLKMIGGFITMHPSIGNWSLPCRSHYWIRRNKVIWAGWMSQQQIERGRSLDHIAKQIYFKKLNYKKIAHTKSQSNGVPTQNEGSGILNSLWRMIKQWWV